MKLDLEYVMDIAKRCFAAGVIAKAFSDTTDEIKTKEIEYMASVEKQIQAKLESFDTDPYEPWRSGDTGDMI